MTQWEYTYLWWEGSATSTANGRLGQTTPPIGEEVMDKLGAMGADGRRYGRLGRLVILLGVVCGSVLLSVRVRRLV